MTVMAPRLGIVIDEGCRAGSHTKQKQFVYVYSFLVGSVGVDTGTNAHATNLLKGAFFYTLASSSPSSR